MYNSIKDFSSSNETCAIAIGLNDSELTHCGILYTYKITGDPYFYFLHLGNPLSLSNEREQDYGNIKGYLSSNPNFIWKPFKNILPFIPELIRTHCMAIAEENSILKYGIFHDENSMFSINGVFHPGQTGSGLTCSSFVKTVLKSCNLNIIDNSNWPDDRDSDIEWLKKMIPIYEKSISEFQKSLRNNLKEQKKNEKNRELAIDIQKSNKKISKNIQLLQDVLREFKEGKISLFKRYRPEEVSACTYQDIRNLPIKFENDNGRKGAEALGQELLEYLKSLKS